MSRAVCGKMRARLVRCEPAMFQALRSCALKVPSDFQMASSLPGSEDCSSLEGQTVGRVQPHSPNEILNAECAAVTNLAFNLKEPP